MLHFMQLAHPRHMDIYVQNSTQKSKHRSHQFRTQTSVYNFGENILSKDREILEKG